MLFAVGKTTTFVVSHIFYAFLLQHQAVPVIV